MAKTKAKSKAAAAASASGNDATIADPAPSSEPVVETNEAANATLYDESEEAVDTNNNKGKEVTENGGLDQPEEIDDGVEEETKDGLDVKLEEEADKVEEAKGGLDDKSDEGDDDDEEPMEADDDEEPMEADDDNKSEEGDEKEEEEKEEEDTKVDDGIIESIGTDVVPEGEKKVEGEGKVQEEKGVKDNNTKGEENAPNKKQRRTRRRKRKASAASVVAAVASNDGGKSQDDTDKRGTAAAEKKELKMADGMGLVFMCNSKTKQDCFRYKVLGLPASKKEMVAKIYKGMRLFLFDIDLKLVYGIYKAASPGGYNIEPKAFKSAFPSQVRFRVLDDCLPVPVEKFKAAIKENYYRKNKFDCQLSPEQVKKLCKLFRKAGKIPKKISGEVIIAEPELPPHARGRRKTKKAVREELEGSSSARGRKRTREVIRGEPKQGRKRTREVIRVEPEQISSRGRKRTRHERERGRPDDNIPISGDRHNYAREAFPSLRDRDHLHARRREAYVSPPSSLALPPLPTYAYVRQGDEYYYRRDPPPPQPLDPRDYRMDLPPPQPLDPRDYQRAGELETRSRQPVEYRDAYSSRYREPIPYNKALYMAPASYVAPLLAADLAPAYAPRPASLATSAYGTPAAYVPSSSLYYRY